MPERGCVIAFEGVEGAGKSTQLRLAAAALRKRGVPVVETREPGGTAIGMELRRILMRLHAPPAPLTELLLYLADRAQHVAEVITPALAKGQLVLTDRFSASTLAYQGAGRQLDIETVRGLDALVRQNVTPALTVLLDCPVSVGMRRARGDDRFHHEARAFHEQVRAAFLSLAEECPQQYCVLDATASTEAVHREVVAAVTACLDSL
ncbi:MAG: dTMP kinase [Candidatus Binatia bacterium]